MKELDLRSFFVMLLQNLRLIIAVAVAMAVVFGVATNLLTEDTYSSRCSMYIMNIAKDEDKTYTGISVTGLEASQRMVNEYIIILKSNSVMEEVAKRVNAHGYEVTPAQVRNSLALSAVDETALLRIISTTHDAKLSQVICDELMAYAPDKIKKVMQELGSITPVDNATLGSLNAPKTTRNAVLGGVFGLVLVCGLVFVRYMMDNTIKDEKDLKNRFNVNVLGVVLDTTGSVDKATGTSTKKTTTTTGGTR